MAREFLLFEIERMMPLVRPILADLAAVYTEFRVQQRRWEIARDCRNAERAAVRRVVRGVKQALDTAQASYELLQAELEALGAIVEDPARGCVAFPFVWSADAEGLQLRSALFLTQLEEDPNRPIQRWRFVDETNERLVPPAWRDEPSDVTPIAVNPINQRR